MKDQCQIDRDVMDLVSVIDYVLDHAQDLKKIEDDPEFFNKVLTDLLTQVAECATFVCEYLKPNFASTRYLLTFYLAHEFNAVCRAIHQTGLSDQKNQGIYYCIRSAPRSPKFETFHTRSTSKLEDSLEHLGDSRKGRTNT